MLPKFKYHPNCLENNVFKKVEENKEVLCMCCGKPSEYYYGTTMYAKENVDCLCPACIADGSAADKFAGSFIQDAEEIVQDEEKTKELFERTPGLITWQGENWLTCCDDYCAFISYVGIKELEEMGIAEEVLADYEKQDAYDVNDVKKYLVKNGSMNGYLFQCLHCGKYRLGVDAD